MNTLTRPHYVEQFQSAGGLLPGASLPWLASLRQTALAQFDATGFPSPREEEWRYTNVAPIEKKRFKPGFAAAPAAAPDAALLERYRLHDVWSLVLVNGIYVPELSALDGIPAGVTITPISLALADDPGFIESRLGSVSANERHGFIAFNTAFFSEGLVLRVPAEQKLSKPVQLLHIATDSDTALSLRSLIVVESGASAQVVETFVGETGSVNLCAAITEVALAERAALDHYMLQHQSERAYHFGGAYACVGRSACFRHTQLSFGALLARHEIHAELDEVAECTLDGLFLGRERQHVDNHTLIHHRAPRAISRETYRGVLADRARGVFQGRIIVHPDAQQTDAQMNNRNLLLSEDAEIDTKPQLEIHADDVKCAHGVAIGQLDEQAVFYLQSRGVDAESARNMLTFAFANAMLDKIELASVKSLAQDELMAKFPQAGIRRDWL